MRTVTQYEPFLFNWPRKAGAKPTTQHFKQAHKLARPGSQNALALAMTLREQGASQPQIIAVTGKPHRNVIKKVASKKQAKVRVTKDLEGRKVYRVSLSA